MNISAVLEVTNGNLSILRLAFLLFLALYVMRQIDQNAGMTLRQWVFAMPLGVAVALSLFVNGVGEFGRTAVVWAWRFFTLGRTPFSDFELGVLCTFAMLAAAGLLAMIRIFTRTAYGNGPWLLCVAGCAIYTGVTIYARMG